MLDNPCLRGELAEVALDKYAPEPLAVTHLKLSMHPSNKGCNYCNRLRIALWFTGLHVQKVHTSLGTFCTNVYTKSHC